MKSTILRLGYMVGAGLLLALGAQAGSVAAQADGTPFTVDSFSQLQVEGAGHAIITIGDPASVTVSGPQDQISNLQVQSFFGTLEIEPENDDNRGAGADLVYHITVPSLSQIELEGSVTAEVDGLSVDSLEIQVEDSAQISLTNLTVSQLQVQTEGSGTVTVTGKADRQQIESEDLAKYDAIGLESRTVEVDSQGSSLTRVRVSESLTGQIEDSATVEYMSEAATVSVSTEDSGTLTQLPFEPLSA